MLSCIMDALEGRDVDVVNIMGYFLHSDMDNIVNIWIDGAMVELLTRVDPSQYEKHVIMKKGKKFFYVRL